MDERELLVYELPGWLNSLKRKAFKWRLSKKSRERLERDVQNILELPEWDEWMCNSPFTVTVDDVLRHYGYDWEWFCTKCNIPINILACPNCHPEERKEGLHEINLFRTRVGLKPLSMEHMTK